MDTVTAAQQIHGMDTVISAQQDMGTVPIGLGYGYSVSTTADT